MFETIVWATDGSELADRALPYVEELARIHGAKIIAVHANELLRGRFGGAPLLADEPDLVEKIEGQVGNLCTAGLEADLKIVTGSHDIPDLIAHAAQEAGADLIVVGTHGHSGLAATLLGSVARGLLHTAHCPVLAVPPAREAPSTEAARATAGVA
jgi:nucleotide-binding universal stress UspA family protein